MNHAPCCWRVLALYFPKLVVHSTRTIQRCGYQRIEQSRPCGPSKDGYFVLDTAQGIRATLLRKPFLLHRALRRFQDPALVVPLDAQAMIDAMLQQPYAFSLNADMILSLHDRYAWGWSWHQRMQVHQRCG